MSLVEIARFQDVYEADLAAAFLASHGVEVDVTEVPVLKDDLFLLCSDGLSDMVEDDDIQLTISTFGANLETLAKQLVLLGNDERLTLFDGRLLASSYQQLDALERSLLDPAQPLVLVPAAEVQVQAIVATLEGLSRAGFAISLGDSQPAGGEVAP